MIYGTCVTASKSLIFRALVLQKSLNSQVKFSSKWSPKKVRMESNLNGCIEGIKKESRGALIVIEGLDRSGKTSQCSRLVPFLEGQGVSAELWRFPDRTTNVGQTISSYLTNTSQLDDHTIHLLFSANRWEKRSLMETKLKTGTTLIVDRYSYSGVAFSSAKGLDIEWCKAPEIGLLAPDVVIYLGISPEVKSLYSVKRCLFSKNCFSASFLCSVLLGSKILRKLQKEEGMEVRDMKSWSFRRKLLIVTKFFVMTPGRLLMLANP